MRGVAHLGGVTILVAVVAGLTVGRLLATLPEPAIGRSAPGHSVATAGTNELRDLTLRPCDLPTASFTTCVFRGDWRNTSFRGVNLWECDLSQAGLSGTDLAGCTYDAVTGWPAGFDPARAGATLDE